MNSFEGNTPNYNAVRDWELSLVTGYDFENTGSGNLQLISLGKRFGEHYFYARYTPGFQKEFKYAIGSVILGSDTSEITSALSTNLHYEEAFGFGYSYNYSKQLSFGFSARYFKQQFTTDKISPYFSDTLNYIGIETIRDKSNFLRADIGLAFKPYENLLFELSTANLLIVENKSTDRNNVGMKNRKSVILRTEINIGKYSSLFALYESRGSAIAGGSYSIPLIGGRLSFGLSASHDYTSNQIVNSLSPAVNYSNDFFSVTLAGVKNFGRDEYLNVDYFLENTIENLSNNIYSGDRIVLGINFALSFTPEKSVEILKAEVLSDIYPAFTEEYKTHPVAKAIVKNITAKAVTVQPVSFIIGLNEEPVYSPRLTIAPKQSAEVFFYTVIPETEQKIEKRFITQINLKIFAKNANPDAEIQKPILVNDANAWNGSVSNLRYFVTTDFTYSQRIAKEILSKFKSEIESEDKRKGDFLRAKFLFNSFVKNILYVSDPRSVTDRVQFPHETMELKGGDCDDLSAAFASMLESIGIQTAFVDYKSDEGISHVNLLFNTKLKPEEAGLITGNDKKYVLRKNLRGKDEIWIPLELTMLTDFDDSWNKAAEKFYNEAISKLGLAKGKVAIIEIY